MLHERKADDPSMTTTPMRITKSALSLNVPDVAASAQFVQDHFGFSEVMAADGFSSLASESAGFNLIFLRTGLGSFKPEHAAGSAGQGLLVVFEVDEIDDEYARLLAGGARVITPIETEPWGERYFQVQDANGIIYQLVQWVGTPGGA